jgi:hypothetical protein
MMTPNSFYYLVQTYVGLDKKQADKLKKEISKWVCSIRHNPGAIMLQRKLFFTNDYGEEINDTTKGGVVSHKMSHEMLHDIKPIQEETKKKSNDSYTCECGVSVLMRNKKRHELSTKHMESM